MVSKVSDVNEKHSGTEHIKHSSYDSHKHYSQTSTGLNAQMTGLGNVIKN